MANFKLESTLYVAEMLYAEMIRLKTLLCNNLLSLIQSDNKIFTQSTRKYSKFNLVILYTNSLVYYWELSFIEFSVQYF